MMERQWGEKKEGLAISVAVGKDSFKESELVGLNVVLRNFGTAPVPIVVRSPWVDYVYTVRDSRGNELPMNAYGQQRAKASLERRKIIRDLQPGESQEDDFELSKGVDLEHPDTYTVFATRTFPWPGHAGNSFTVQSNAITFQTTR